MINTFAAATLGAIVLTLPIASQAAPLTVAVSILPEKYFVQKIGGDHVKVQVVMSAGAEPESYAPTPREMTELSQDKIYFTMGVPFEKAWLPRFTSSNPDIEIAPLYERVCLRAWPAGMGDDDASSSSDDKESGAPCRPEDADPHSWISPALVRIMAGTIRDRLIADDPANADDYRANFRSFIKEINDVDTKIADTLGGAASGKTFMVYHPAFGYFARAYGLHQMPVEKFGTEPTPSQLAKVVSLAKEKDIKVIFVQPQFSQKAAKTIAGEIGGSVVSVDPLEEDWGKNMVSIAEAFANAFK